MKRHDARRRVRLALAGAALLLAQPAAARVEDLAELSLEDLMQIEVTSASKYAQSADRAPSAVTVVTREDIRRFGWRNLSDVLAAQRGFHTYYDRSYHYLGVRGFAPPGDYNNRIQFLVDGLRLNDNIYDSVMAGESFPLDLDLVERIEIVRGPGATIYGGNALFGVVNLVTRSGEGVGAAELSADIGSQQARRFRASTGGERGELSWLISASGYRSDGGRYEFPDIAAGRLSPEGSDADRAERVFARLRLGDWYGQLVHSDRNKHRPGGQYGTIFDDPTTQDRDRFTIGEIGSRRAMGEHREMDVRLFAGQYRYDFSGAYDYSGTGGAAYMINRDHQIGEWWGGELKWTSTAWAGQKWVAGLNYTRNSRQFMRNSDDDGTVYNPVTDQDSSRYGVFAQDEIILNDATTLMLGLRHDVAESRKHFTSPRIAVTHQITTGHTLKLLYGTAFRTPNVYERLYPSYGTPTLKAEGMKTLEAVWEGRLDSQTRATTSLYRYTMKDTVAYDPVSRVNVNSPAVTGNGGEFEIERRWSNGALLRGSYSAQFLRQDGQRPDNAPSAIYQVLAGLPVGPQGLFAALEMRGLTARKSGGGPTRVAGHTLTNATLSWRPVDSSWEWSATLYNLFDKRYDDPAVTDPALIASGLRRDRFEQDGRSFRLKAVVRY